MRIQTIQRRGRGLVNSSDDGVSSNPRHVKHVSWRGNIHSSHRKAEAFCHLIRELIQNSTAETDVRVGGNGVKVSDSDIK